MKKLPILLLSLPSVALFALSSCGSNTPASEDDNPYEKYYTKDEYEFEEVYSGAVTKTLPIYNADTPRDNELATINVNTNIGNNNYIKLVFNTNVNLVGYINYVNVNDEEEGYSEKFYVEKEEDRDKAIFTTFLDAFRLGAYGAYSKKITTIEVMNVDEENSGTVLLESLSISDRTYDLDQELYIENDTMKFGTRFTHGGCISYLERTDQDVVEYIDTNGDVKIAKDVDVDELKNKKCTVVSTNVNFVNCYDLGREVQTSYYLNADESNGYSPKTEFAYPGSLSGAIYNPIQCGSVGGKNPQIIDYVYSEDLIYVKAKASDWMYLNDQAFGYIEAWYYFGDDDGVLICDCSYVDFGQFYDSDTNKLTFEGQECPACYFVYPLQYFYAETKQGTIMDSEVTWQGNDHTYSTKTSKNDGVSSPYMYGLPKKQCNQGWFANVNEDYFGAGLYMPNADYYVASRGSTDCSYTGEEQNHSYLSDQYPEYTEDDIIPSCAVSNYNYLCPSVRRKMVDFTPLEYSYAICIGTTDEMSEAFTKLGEEGIITNENLLDNSGWPKR